jgi:DNA/RNA-binding domain of Phe-tRNA-synthetase-like protein
MRFRRAVFSWNRSARGGFGERSAAVMIRLETDAVSLGIVRLEGIAIPAEYDDLPAPEPRREIAVARKLYRAIGIDPTRYRPASEALLRRLKKGLGLPRINALVDAINHCSVVLTLPFGGYDLDRTCGEIALRIGRPGEEYRGLGKPRVNLDGRYALCDSQGPFGNPSSDSWRTRITGETKNALIVVFAPPEDPHELLGWVGETMTTVVGGRAETEVVR